MFFCNQNFSKSKNDHIHFPNQAPCRGNSRLPAVWIRPLYFVAARCFIYSFCPTGDFYCCCWQRCSLLPQDDSCRRSVRSSAAGREPKQKKQPQEKKKKSVLDCRQTAGGKTGNSRFASQSSIFRAETLQQTRSSFNASSKPPKLNILSYFPLTSSSHTDVWLYLSFCNDPQRSTMIHQPGNSPSPVIRADRPAAAAAVWTNRSKTLCTAW